MASVPIWAFTGDGDDLVNPAGTIDTAGAPQGSPAPSRWEVLLIVYPGVGHDVWDHAYSGRQARTSSRGCWASRPPEPESAEQWLSSA